MIIDYKELIGLKSELAYLDKVTTELGFIRWQWEYYRATYDLKYEDKVNNAEYYLRISTRVLSGKLEAPDTVLAVENCYMGTATYPHGLDYESPIPQKFVDSAKQTLAKLTAQLTG